jgi:hypothetical protein
MTTGTLGQATPTANTNTTIYTVPASTTAVITASVLNRGGSVVTARLAVASTGTPTNSEWIEYNVVIPPNGVLERSGIIMSTGKLLVAHCSTGDCTVNVWGMEETN